MRLPSVLVMASAPGPVFRPHNLLKTGPEDEANLGHNVFNNVSNLGTNLLTTVETGVLEHFFHSNSMFGMTT